MNVPQALPKPLIPLKTEGLTLDSVGGKALNLAKLAGASFHIPNAFFIPTPCYRDFISQNNLNPKITHTLQKIDPRSPDALNTASGEIRDEFVKGNLSSTFIDLLVIGWHWLGGDPVAVRSSATAEDLPELSFAGLQDTFLNIIDPQALQDAVVACWSSLWTAEAIGYRNHNQIHHQSVSMCVVIQKMVQSTASGVLFTANPLTGKRTKTVIDATLGLGEALVGGHVDPDHLCGKPGPDHIAKKPGS